MSPTPNDCEHLTVEQVREIHASALENFGGSHGIRDEGLLESAIAAPQATAFGVSPFVDLIDLAAAYLFYICRNHAFYDGNKRTAMAACIIFLKMNSVEPKSDSEGWETLVLDVAASRLDREETTKRLHILLS